MPIPGGEGTLVAAQMTRALLPNCYRLRALSCPEPSAGARRTKSPTTHQARGALGILLSRNALDGLRSVQCSLTRISFRDRPIQPLSHLSARVLTGLSAGCASRAIVAATGFATVSAQPQCAGLPSESFPPRAWRNAEW